MTVGSIRGTVRGTTRGTRGASGYASDQTAQSGQSVDDTGMAELARAVVSRLATSAERRAELLGEAFLACEQLRRDRPADFAQAAAQGQLTQWCLPLVRAALREGDPLDETQSRARGGWMGTYVAPDGRSTASDDAYTGADREALELGQRALARAVSRAKQEGNTTLLRNLRWYKQRLEHRTYDAIAREEGRVPATVRTGVARARRFVLRIVHELQHAQPAPLSADAAPELEPLRQLWLDQELEALARELERTREQFGGDPHWLNLAALLAADRARRPEARELYERALVQADAAPIRARILNNLANLADDEGQLEEARLFWTRAHQLAPQAAAPLLNLLASASVERDYASAQHFVALLGELLSSGRLSETERGYALRRLGENPKFGWLRDTEAWRLGPARWLRAAPSSSSRRLLRVVSTGMLVLLASLPTLGFAAPHASPPAVCVSADDTPDLGSGDEAPRGGDSMGSPMGRGGGDGK